MSSFGESSDLDHSDDISYHRRPKKRFNQPKKSNNRRSKKKRRNKPQSLSFASIINKPSVVFGIIICCFGILVPKVFWPFFRSLFGFNRSQMNEDNSPPRRPFAAASAQHQPARFPGSVGGMPNRGMGDASSFQQSKSEKSSLTLLLPVYAIGIALYMLYTLYKVFFKAPKKSSKRKHYYDDISIDSFDEIGQMNKNIDYSSDTSLSFYNLDDTDHIMPNNETSDDYDFYVPDMHSKRSKNNVNSKRRRIIDEEEDDDDDEDESDEIETQNKLSKLQTMHNSLRLLDTQLQTQMTKPTKTKMRSKYHKQKEKVQSEQIKMQKLQEKLMKTELKMRNLMGKMSEINSETLKEREKSSRINDDNDEEDDESENFQSHQDSSSIPDDERYSHEEEEEEEEENEEEMKNEESSYNLRRRKQWKETE
ncbi:hypothetical protein SNEBB_002836 [Seison nebaliae]|nr:hypothetical protein SNEBB_002836 [Seison nebaliae]